MTGEVDEQQEFIDSGADEIASTLFGAAPEAPAPKELGTDPDPIARVDPAADTTTTPDPAALAPLVKAPPSSWGKESHELWAKATPELQAQIEKREKQYLEGLGQYREHHELGKSMKDVITPYMAIIQAQGITPDKAVASLLNAQYRLMHGTQEERLAMYRKIGEDFGFSAPSGATQEQVDPKLAPVLQRMEKLEGALTQRQREQFQEHSAQVARDVSSFADAVDDKGNKVNPYFDEVSAEVITFINAGDTLKDAYDKAVWANPLTRAKESARIKTEAQQELRTKAKGETESARRASSTNVRSRDTSKAPTEPLGKMEDTMKNVLADIRKGERTH